MKLNATPINTAACVTQVCEMTEHLYAAFPTHTYQLFGIYDHVVP